MANLVMESFQVVNHPADINYFNDNIFKQYSKFTNGGRDGNKIAVIGRDFNQSKDVNFAPNNVATGLYMGFRFYKKQLFGYSSDYYVSLWANFGNNRLECRIKKNGFELPSGKILPINMESNFIEIGVDQTYFEFRIDNNTVYRMTHKFSNPTDIGMHWSSYVKIGILDLYVNDSTSSVNNSFFGDIKINAYPVNANGSLNTGFSSSTGGDLYLAVDDIPADISEWVEAVNIGDQVTFQLTDLPSDESPLAVKVSAQASKMAATDSGIKLLSKIGDDIYKSDKRTLPVEGTQITYIIHNQSPAGIPWKSSDLNALEIGMEIVP